MRSSAAGVPKQHKGRDTRKGNATGGIGEVVDPRTFMKERLAGIIRENKHQFISWDASSSDDSLEWRMECTNVHY